MRFKDWWYEQSSTEKATWGGAVIGGVIAATTAIVVALVQGAPVIAAVPTSAAPGLATAPPVPTAAPGGCAKNPHDPSAYLSGRVKIGVNGRLPGWSLLPETSNNELWSGFDIDLGRYLAKRHNFTPVFTGLTPRDREPALSTCGVDMVLANYSITEKRKQKVDFVGPYFHDHSGVLYSRQKFAKLADRSVIPISKTCVTDGTTAHDYLRLQNESPYVASSLPDCMTRYLNPDDPSVVAVVTDETILDAYARSHDVADAPMPAFWPGTRTPIQDELYGIGLPHGSVELCRVLTEDLYNFLSSPDGWDADFGRNLAPSQSELNRKPDVNDLAACQ